jgi:putative FmdB family regulatory protein
MPVYAFTCPGCGAFDLMRPMAESAAPALCPTCGSQARRLFTPPGVARLARPALRALEMEEKSAHEPEIVTEKGGRPRPHRHGRQPPWVLSH